MYHLKCNYLNWHDFKDLKFGRSRTQKNLIWQWDNGGKFEEHTADVIITSAVCMTPYWTYQTCTRAMSLWIRYQKFEFYDSNLGKYTCWSISIVESTLIKYWVHDYAIWRYIYAFCLLFSYGILAVDPQEFTRVGKIWTAPNDLQTLPIGLPLLLATFLYSLIEITACDETNQNNPVRQDRSHWGRDKIATTL